MTKIFSILSIFLLSFSCNNNKSDSKSGVEYIAIDPSEYLEKVENAENFYFIDVRTPQEFQEGSIGEAINIDFMQEDFKSNIMKLDNQKDVFIYCRSGNRSKKSFEIFKELGFTNIIDLKGGYIAYDKHTKQ